jgi:hypothetical protein
VAVAAGVEVDICDGTGGFLSFDVVADDYYLGHLPGGCGQENEESRELHFVLVGKVSNRS